ncbi:MAG: hypothetical protein AB7W16_19635 [Candidatus Obscuribacterales bacterium]
MIKRQRIVWEEEAKKHCADLARVQVWDAFSEMFLDSYRNDEEQQWLAELIADSPFSFAELAHILIFEVAPVCGPNLFQWPGGEWAGFEPNWLIERCLARQNAHPFVPGNDPDKPPLWIHALALGPSSEAYFLLYRVKRIRDS